MHIEKPVIVCINTGIIFKTTCHKRFPAMYFSNEDRALNSQVQLVNSEPITSFQYQYINSQLI